MNFKTILIVEDDSEDTNLLTEALIELDPSLEFVIAQNGLEALTLLDKLRHPPKLIILDINMPKMNGLNCLAEIKKDKRYVSVPVVFFSSTFLHYDQSALLNMGAMHCVKKPNNYEELRTISLLFFDIIKK